MSNKRDLKKDLNYVFGDIIDAALVWQIANPKEDATKSEAIIDESINSFDALIAETNKRKVENPKAHFSGIRHSFETKATELVAKINSL
ncbi:hypothetical protein IMCC3317_41680 [Kordia antarctica]|uniref:Uncharacterized protein n=1 Tax=Kordia antarctica TaxID=1218801 RepID=A0A7L4ZQL4_9FLAO|nr:hypothetical protein [Kordia antarctica]QHI38769.1 hypothetical protein IMCC3317_41680 [Kordia antarctica]